MNEERVTRKLRDFYEFDDDDLAANRQGRLSPKQVQVIQSVSSERRMLGNAIGIVAGVIGLCVLAVVAFALFLSWVTQEWNAGANTGMVSGVVGTIVLFAVGFYFRRLLLSKARSKYILRAARGTVHLKNVSVHRAESHRGIPDYEQHQMQIGDALFVLDDELVGLMKEGDKYAVYYVDYQDGSEGIIQSLEPLQ